jgi:cytochrome c-type biogenesis protein CcmH/NrfG
VPVAASVEAVPETGEVGPNVSRTKTEIFRDRMKELKEQEAIKAAEPEPAEPSEAEVTAAANVTEEPKKKKGCMGMIVIAFGITAAGVVAHLHGWV